MKKSLFSFMALATTLLMASCSNDDLTQVTGSDEAKVSFSISLESEAGTKSRAISDGKSVDKLYYAVFDEDGKLWNVKTTTTVEADNAYGITGLKKAAIAQDGIIQSEGKKQDIIMLLAKGQTYKIVFWAQNDFAPDANPYTFSYTEGQNFDINIDYTKMKTNNDDMDAFFAIVDYTVSNNANADDTETVILKRPFAQLNVGVTTTDWDAAVASGFTTTKSKVVFKNVGTKLNLFTGAVSEPQIFTSSLENIPADTEILTLADGSTYKYLSSTYVLINDESATGDTRSTLANAEFYFEDENGQTAEFKDGLTNIPVERNWRTNFVGQILTGNIQFEVSIDQNYIGDVTNHKVVNTIAEAQSLFDAGVVTSVEITGTEGGTLLLPRSKEAASISFTNQIPSDKTIEIGYYTSNANEHPEVVSITGNFQGPIRIITPNSTVYGKGNFPNVYVETATNTFHIASGSTVGTLTVGKGNVVIEEESEVEKIDNQSQTPITVTLAEGVEAPETSGSTIVFVTDNNEVDTAEGLAAAVANAEAGATIILKNDITIANILNITKDLIINGNGHTLTYTGEGASARAFDVRPETNGVNLTLKDLIIDFTSNDCQRGINYNTNGTLNLENVTIKGTNVTYAVNMPGSSNEATVNMTNCNITGLIALNVWGKDATINITDTHLTSVDNNDAENYAAIKLNNDGTTIADGTAITVTGGSITAKDENGDLSSAVSNSTNTGKVNISSTTTVTGKINEPVAIVEYGTPEFYSCLTLEEAIEKAIETKGNVRLIKDIELDADNTIAIEGVLTLNLNGKNITGLTDQTGYNRNMFDVKKNGNLTVIGDGTITIEHKGENMGWNNSTNVFNVTDGGILNIENATIKNLGGSDMAFVAHLNNWGEVTLNVNNSTLESTYIAVRVFNSGNDNNNVNIKNSTLNGKYCFWVHNYTLADFGNDQNKVNAHKELLKFDIFNGGESDNKNTFTYSNSYAPILYGFTNPIYLDEYGDMYSYVGNADELVEALENGYHVVFTDDIKIDPANMSNAYGTTGINVKNGQTIDGGKFTLDIQGAGGTWDSGINTTGGIIKNITVTGSFRGIFINHNSEHSEKVILENVTTTGTVYTISCDQGKNQDLEATNCTFNGWTSYAATLGNAKFTNCKFNEGSGYAYCRPYAPTEFVGCEFEEGFEMDPRAKVTFKDCKLNGVALTSENLATLVTSNIANASIK